ncbi:swr complex subunit [Rhizina undulata]
MTLTPSLLDEYDSADDSDFDPTAPISGSPTPEVSDDSEESEPDTKRSRGKAKGKGKAGESVAGGKKRKRTERTPSPPGGSGIRTRAQRIKDEKAGVKEKVEEEGEGKEGGADVDALWREMNSKEKEKETEEKKEEKKEEAEEEKKEEAEVVTYTFAGEIVTAPTPASTSTSTAPTDPNAPTRRPPPKKRTSAFDSAAAARKPATKLNTLEKSKLDWESYIDKEGIGDELKQFNKGEKGYLEKQAFLGRVEEKRDSVWREGQRKR